MGGNAIGEGLTRRFKASEFKLLEKEVVDILQEEFIYSKVKPLLYYRKKPDFGDLDVLLELNGFLSHIDQVAYFKNLFRSKKVVKNSNVISLEYREIQVDIIITPEEIFDSSYNYFAWNDLGNLIGRIAHKVGLKYGHDGLWYIHREGTHQVFEILLTRDIDQILRFLGYYPNRFHDGFNTLHYIYDYVISSHYFNKEIYSLDNRNHAARIRDKKRATYTGFLQYIENVESKYFFNPDKSVYLPNILFNFGKQKEFKQCMEKYQDSLEVKKKFNGNLVSELTGLSGKDLGQFMAGFKEKHGMPWLSVVTQEQINDEILKEFEKCSP